MTTLAPAARSFDASAAIVGSKWRDPQSLNVGREGRPQRTDRHDAHQAHFDPGGLHETRWPDVRPLDGPARRGIDQICREEGIPRLGGARLERATQVARQLPRRRRVDRPEVEVVVADRLRGVPHRVVRVDDEGALAEIRLDAALKRVAGVDEQDRPAVCRPGRAQIVHVSREQRQAAAPVLRKGRPVEIAGPDDRQGHQRRFVRRGGEPREERCVAPANQRNAGARMPRTIRWTALPDCLLRITGPQAGSSPPARR